MIDKITFLGESISRRVDNRYLSATDLVRIGNKTRFIKERSTFMLCNYFYKKSTKEIMSRIEAENLPAKISGRGRGAHTWVHPCIFLDMALSIDTEFSLVVYKWLIAKTKGDK